MLSFKSFINLTRSLTEKKSTGGTYAAVYPDRHSTKLISGLLDNHESKFVPDGAQRQSIDNFHATVLYSRKTLDKTECFSALDPLIPIHAIGDEYALFSQSDGKKCLILKLTSLGLKNAHTLLRKLGGTHDYPTYEAHVTLVRDLPENWKIPELPAPRVEITFTIVKVEPIKKDAV